MPKSNSFLLFYAALDWCRDLQRPVYALKEAAYKFRCDGGQILEYLKSGEAFKCDSAGDRNASAMIFCSKPTAETVGKVIKFHRSERTGDRQYDEKNSCVLGCFINTNSLSALGRFIDSNSLIESETVMRLASEAIERVLYKGVEYFRDATIIQVGSHGRMIMTCEPEKSIKTLLQDL